MRGKIIIVGQAPSRTSDPREALSGRSGARLAGLCGLSLPDFLDRFERYNVLPGWLGKDGKGDRFLELGDARQRASLKRSIFGSRRVVILGAINAAAFGVLWPKLSFRDHWDGQFAWCPHPSGINRWWNDPLNVALARVFWERLAQEPDLEPLRRLTSS